MELVTEIVTACPHVCISGFVLEYQVLSGSEDHIALITAMLKMA